ncbi:MAG TPA: F0F1 ATP synthase subunit A [Pirellulales bacterium]|nr:F0F1 ATP synthase subunit A [Pirellulales bacterium]
MSNPVFHIKDGYYFEVPKFLWHYHYTDTNQFEKDYPFFPKQSDLYHQVRRLSPDELNRELSGKIIIPQPFATLKNLYDKESGFAVSKFMLLELLAAAIMAFIFIRVGRRIATGRAPQGKSWNMCEAMLVFVRDEIAVSAMGEHEAERFTPLLWTMFFFILTCNLLGLIPWLGAPTGAFAVTFGLACVVFCTSFGSGIMRFGPLGFWLNQVPSMDLPWWLQPLKLPIFVIEVLSTCIKHAILSVRLLANMVAGHLVLLAILGLIVAASALGTGQWLLVATISVLSSTLFSVLELFVAFLQAYVFTFLSALFISAAVHHH